MHRFSGFLPAREAYFVAREEDMTISQEAFAENIGECMVFFVEEEDAGVGCACCRRSATTSYSKKQL
jgi:hypothetical protein